MNNLKILNWIKNAIEESKFDKYIDIHIDEISRISKYKKDWIIKASNAYSLVKDLLKQFSNQHVVLLCIPLKDTQIQKNWEVNNLNELKGKLSHTPPSIYILKKGSPYYNNIVANKFHLKGSLNYFSSSTFNKNEEIYVNFLYLLDT